MGRYPEPMSALETEDIDGINLLAAGGPYHGSGTAKGGDFYSVDDLRAFAAKAHELSGEVRIPIKLGHSPQQALLRESGLFDEHGQPAAGWIENLRVEGEKLLGDAKRVPKKLAELVKVGAFRTRSVEQRNYTSQRTGKQHGWVIDGLALLGGKAPAVRTLDDIVALYSAPDADLPELGGEPDEGVRTINFSAGSITGSRMADAPLTLTPEQTAAVAKALGAEPKDLAPEKLLAAIESATKAAETAAADKSKTDLDEAQKKLADAETELKALKAAAGSSGETGKELAETLKKLADEAKAGVAAAEELRVMRRDTLIDNTIRRGALEPALRKQYAELYDASPDLTKATLEAMPRREELFKTFGADGADISGGKNAGEPSEDDAKEQKLLEAWREEMGLPNTKTAVAA